MGFSWPKVKVKEIIMEEENKKVTRRKFLEDSSKKALAGTAAAFLGLSMVKPTVVKAAGCWPWCYSTCSGGCSDACEDSCSGGCQGSCYIHCWGTCSCVCLFGGRTVHANQSTGCGTPVLEREASNRHITA